MRRTISLVLCLSLLGAVVLSDAAIATPFETRVGPQIGTGDGAAGPHAGSVSAGRPPGGASLGSAVSGLLGGKRARRGSESSSGLLLALGLLGLTALSGRKFDIDGAARDSATR